VAAAACGGAAPSSPTGLSGELSSAFLVTGGVRWAFDGEQWQPPSIAPDCPADLRFTTPTDLSTVTSVLYPGQIRGNDFRPHGGFRFDRPGQPNDIVVSAPMDGAIYRVARYLEGGDVQHMLDILNECGILHRLDHLSRLSPPLQAIADLLPPPTEGDSRTMPVGAGHAVRAGETLAVGVGSLKARNLFFDWGVYDVRQRNAASDDPAWLASHPGEFASYAICWFNHLDPGDAAIVRSLPPGSSESGALSAYCR
jgi:hypothetical protein